jgi:hypothetical protein
MGMTSTNQKARRFYSASSRGFYSSDVNQEMPADVVEITEQQWCALIEAQSVGKQIVPDSSGHPSTVDFVETVEMKQRDLKARMARIDAQTTRALREQSLGIAARPGQPTAADRLKSLDQQMENLRSQLGAIS